jgi:invasion protein IalB
MRSVVKWIGITALLAVFGVAVFEASISIADTPVGRNSQAAQNSPQGARPALPQPPARAEERAPRPQPEAGSAQAQVPAAQPQPPQEAPALKIPLRTEILRFDGWIVTCNEFEGPKRRACSALLQIMQEKTNQTVFSWTVGLNNNKQVVSVFQTPTGVVIAPGLELRIGNSPARKIPFATCDNGRCVATTTVDANMLREMTTSPTAQAVIQSEQGKTIEFNIQMNGFDKAYAVLSRP